MLKQICFFKKRDDMTMEEFMDYYENQLSQLAKKMGAKPAIPMNRIKQKIMAKNYLSSPNVSG